MEKKRRIIIDTDPGIDDAAAIAIALFSENLDVRLITTVAGNVGLENVTNNTLKLLTLFKKQITVAKGCSEPLLEKLVDASNVHGLTGMEGYEFKSVDTSMLVDVHAVEAMRKEILNSEEKTTIVAIAPLTNVALLLKMYPEVKTKIDEIVLMGGSMTRGNRGVMSEFNIATDPEAAKIVFDCDVKKTMLPVDIGWKALVFPQDSEKIKSMGVTGDMLYCLFKRYRGGSMKTGLKMYDSTAIAYLCCPEMYEMGMYNVDVETKSSLSNGLTLVDLRNYSKKEPNCNVVTDINQHKFTEWFLDSIQKCI